MTRGICLSAVALVLLAAPAFAQDKCGPGPVAPKVPNGKTAAASELTATATEIKAFVKASDEWQNCLLTDLTEQQAAAKANKVAFDNKIKTAIEAKGDANQKEKEKVGKEYNTAVVAYKAAHK